MDSDDFKTAPDFTLPSTNGEMVTLSQQTSPYILLYFYPKDDTSGCTTEALQFKELYKQFIDYGVTVFGVSKDSMKSHLKFKEKYDLPFHLLSDEGCEMIKSYHCWVEKSMYGRKYMGIERSSFLIDRTGNIVAQWRKVKIKGHAEEILKILHENAK